MSHSPTRPHQGVGHSGPESQANPGRPPSAAIASGPVVVRFDRLLGLYAIVPLVLAATALDLLVLEGAFRRALPGSAAWAWRVGMDPSRAQP